ncbi:MAG: hypothetical protein LBM96_10080 [Methanobrevibacter sp.]|jgi:shikimate kinase|nr:hypothetical protein [Candidatus Methanoflexus mossambicus]
MKTNNRLKNIVLVGIPYSGKTTMGELLADELNMDYLNLDKKIANLTIDKKKNWNRLDWISPDGYSLYWQTTLNCVQSLKEIKTPTVISTGAEVSLHYVNLKIFREIGYIIHLKRDPETLIECFKKVKTCSEREDYYRQLTMKLISKYSDYISTYDEIADILVDNNGPKEKAVNTLVELSNLLFQLDFKR